jgi:hypothetical protein
MNGILYILRNKLIVAFLAQIKYQCKEEQLRISKSSSGYASKINRIP